MRRVASYLEGEEAFCFTYGDGVANIDIAAEIAFHKAHGKLATVCSVVPPGRYGALKTEADGTVRGFTEKPMGDGGKINGGFFVLSPKVLPLIAGDEDSWEGDVLTGIAEQGELMAFEHDGFWQAMDTLREKNQLEAMWQSGKAPWKMW